MNLDGTDITEAADHVSPANWTLDDVRQRLDAWRRTPAYQYDNREEAARRELILWERIFQARENGEQPPGDLDLELNRLGLIELSPTLYHMPGLRNLYVSTNWRLRVSEHIANWTSLLCLDLSGCGLSSLPQSIGALTELRRLNLANNEFVSLPSQLRGCTGLLELNALSK